MAEYVVELKHVTKRFPGVIAMHDMHIQIKPGEIHGLIGENGAGKSTLIKVLTGVHIPEEGEIYIDGKKVSFANPVQSREAGIACVYQELNIVPMLPVVDNVFMGRNVTKPGGLLDYPRMHREAHEALTVLGHPEIDTHTECGKLGMGLQQMVEIAKAITVNAKLLIMDEPTSSLGEQEVKELMTTVRKLKSQGIAILFVSHKLEELFELCDRVTVMRDGEHIDTRDIADWNNDSLIQAMVGRSLENQFPKEFGVKGECMLEVKNLKELGVLKDVSFKAYGGQILAFAGLVGAGRTETVRAIFGMDPKESGDIYVDGQKVTIEQPLDAIRAGIGFVTEDRKGEGLVLPLPISQNMTLATLDKFGSSLHLNLGQEKATVSEYIGKLNIKTPSMQQLARNLSGGNQQKVVLAKWLLSDSKVIIFDEPTRGIDVGAKIEVYNIINDLIRQGVAVVMISSELPEILGMSDRVAVMHQGEITGVFDNDGTLTQEKILYYATGGDKHTA